MESERNDVVLFAFVREASGSVLVHSAVEYCKQQGAAQCANRGEGEELLRNAVAFELQVSRRRLGAAARVAVGGAGAVAGAEGGGPVGIVGGAGEAAGAL